MLGMCRWRVCCLSRRIVTIGKLVPSMCESRAFPGCGHPAQGDQCHGAGGMVPIVTLYHRGRPTNHICLKSPQIGAGGSKILQYPFFCKVLSEAHVRPPC